jgi:hypothetical protein
MASTPISRTEYALLGDIACNAIALDAAIGNGDSLGVLHAIQANRRAIDRWHAHLNPPEAGTVARSTTDDER